ncbi:MAG: glycogen debranching enzyme N-terminal domain-containing protein, partial [Bacteroidales bacterium]
MAYLEFNKKELVNLEYSLKREYLSTNNSGGYLNTTISGCNTRKYHGLLVLPIKEFNNDKHVLLSSLDETLIQHNKEFNLGIHCYGEVYEPRGHKYIVNLEIDKLVAITYAVGGMVLRKTMMFSNKEEQMFISYTLLDAHSPTTFRLKPFLAFRHIHALSKANSEANTKYQM